MLIKNIKQVEPRTVYAIQTSTATFIADGLAHHNCFACNNYHSGRLDVYTVNLIRDYGMDWLNKLSDDAQKASKGKDSYSIEEMLEVEKDLKAKLEVIRKRIN